MHKNLQFPIKSASACLNKWTWSTIWLQSGTTASCHRIIPEEFDVKDFDNFHNTSEKIHICNFFLMPRNTCGELLLEWIIFPELKEEYLEFSSRFMSEFEDSASLLFVEHFLKQRKLWASCK